MVNNEDILRMTGFHAMLDQVSRRCYTKIFVLREMREAVLLNFGYRLTLSDLIKSHTLLSGSPCAHLFRASAELGPSKRAVLTARLA